MIYEERIKRYMDDIIITAFSDKTPMDLGRYKLYKLKIIQKENKTSSGKYIAEGHIVEVYNPSLGEHHIAKCCLHELAHHIDYIQNNLLSHQKTFYEIYEKLIYASLDLGILTTEDFNDRLSSDAGKVAEIIRYYRPAPKPYYMQKDILIRIYNGYSVKDTLKEQGYEWNGLEQVWEKYAGTGYQNEEEFLKENGIRFLKEGTLKKNPYYKIEEADMHIDATVVLIAEGNTYEHREKLKECGFFYNAEQKNWKIKVKASEMQKLMKKLKEEDDLKNITFLLERRKKQ